MSTDFKLDSRLEHDCHKLGKHQCCHILLMDNALYPWFILVPETNKLELVDLEKDQQQMVMETISLISNFIRKDFTIEKLNTAWIGNIVQQLHIHIVGRHSQDAAWPNTVWGIQENKRYDVRHVEKIRQSLSNYIHST